MTFLILPAATVDTIPRLAKITKSKVILLKINRRFNDYFIDFIKFDDFPSDSIKNDLVKINKLIESIVSENHITIIGFIEDLKHDLMIMNNSINFQISPL